MAVNPEYYGKEYIKNLPESTRKDTDRMFEIYEAFIAGFNIACIPENRTSINKDYYSQIIDIVCGYYRTTYNKINSKTRKREIVQIRQICFYFADKYTNLSLQDIGQKLAGSHHSTVIHGIKAVNNLIDTDRVVASDIQKIDSKIKKLMI